MINLKKYCKKSITQLTFKKKKKERKIEIFLLPTIFNFQNPTAKNSLEFSRKPNPFA